MSEIKEIDEVDGCAPQAQTNSLGEAVERVQGRVPDEMVRRDMRGASPLSFLVQHGKLPRIFLLVDVRARLNIEQYEQLHSPVELSEAGGVPGGLSRAI